MIYRLTAQRVVGWCGVASLVGVSSVVGCGAPDSTIFTPERGEFGAGTGGASAFGGASASGGSMKVGSGVGGLPGANSGGGVEKNGMGGTLSGVGGALSGVGGALSGMGGALSGTGGARNGALGGNSTTGGQGSGNTGGAQSETGGRTQAGGSGGSVASGGRNVASGGQTNNAGCMVQKMWAAGFAEDPTQLDINGDNIKDWRLRDGEAFPTNELAGGVWHATSGYLLDTAPGNSFNQRVIVDVRLRHPGLASDAIPAVFWINVNGPNAPVVSVAAEVRHVGASQRFRLSTLGQDSQMVELYTLAGLEDDLVEVHLEITPSSRQVKVSVAGVPRGTFQALEGSALATDAFASLWSGSGGAEFGSVSVQLCAE